MLHVLDDFTHELLQQEKCDLQAVTSFSVFVSLQSGVLSLNRHCGSMFGLHSSITRTVPEEILYPARSQSCLCVSHTASDPSGH